jgi:hypothetical protein
MKLPWRWVDLISSEAKPKISPALADFILATARISFYARVRITNQDISIVVHLQKSTNLNRGLSIFHSSQSFR